MGKVIEVGPCPVCPSSDAYKVHVQDDGTKDATCYSCKYFTRDPYGLRGRNNDTLKTTPVPQDAAGGVPIRNPSNGSRVNTPPLPSLEEYDSHPVRDIPLRHIKRETCEKYGVKIGVDTRDGVTPIYTLFPFFDEENTITGLVFRPSSVKDFRVIGSVKSDQMFGLNTIKGKGKKLFITEGAYDCLALYQTLKEGSTFDWDPDVISIPHGTNSAVKSISENLDIINSYDEIILAFDQDAPGKEASKEVAKMLAGKVYLARFPEKDPNEMLIQGKNTELKWAVLTNARKYQPDGIVNAKDCWDRYKNVSETECYPYPPTMPGLNQKMYGARPGTIVTVTSGTGAGKSQFLRELKYHYWSTTDEKIADIALEEDVGDTIGGLLSLHLNKRITLPDVKVSEAAEKQAFSDIFNSGRFTMYDYFGGMDDDNLFSKLHYFTSTGHRFIFLDHLSIIVSEYAAEGGERERIDTIMTKLAKLVKETGAIIFLVVHLKKAESSRRTFEEGAIPSLDDLRGSGTLKQLSWDVIGLSRNQQHPDERCANTSELHSLKCRFTGRTGSCGYLYFDDNTGRMMQCEEPEGYRKIYK